MPTSNHTHAYTVCTVLRCMYLKTATLPFRGDTIELICKYDVGRDAIYSVKWYKVSAGHYKEIPEGKATCRLYRAIPEKTGSGLSLTDGQRQGGEPDVRGDSNYYTSFGDFL
jgi:hypothetical protein